MSYDCYCDYDAPSVYNATTPRAKKAYRCCECGGHILPGERYESAFGVWDGCASTYRTCERCFDLRMWVKNNVPCLCMIHGDQDEQNEMAISDARHRAPAETRGLLFGFLRRQVLRDRHNRASAQTTGERA